MSKMCGLLISYVRTCLRENMNRENYIFLFLIVCTFFNSQKVVTLFNNSY